MEFHVMFEVQVRKSQSALGKLWDLIKSLVAVAVLCWIGWSAYSLWDPASSRSGEPEQATRFNCKKAKAERESDYACIESESCTMSPKEMTEVKEREADIDENCNLPFNPMADAVL